MSKKSYIFLPSFRVLHCIVMVGIIAGETSAKTPDSTVEHLADSFQGLPNAHSIMKYTSTKTKDKATARTFSAQDVQPEVSSFLSHGS
jgi:hypothetical protein